jgi:hypothetical protein
MSVVTRVFICLCFSMQTWRCPLFTMRPLGLSIHRAASRWGCPGTSVQFQTGAQRIAARPLILLACSKLRPGRWMSAATARSRDAMQARLSRSAHCLILPRFSYVYQFCIQNEPGWTTPDPTGEMVKTEKGRTVSTDPTGFQFFFVQKLNAVGTNWMQLEHGSKRMNCTFANFFLHKYIR